MKYIILVVLVAFLTAGCASGSFNMASIAGLNMQDLETARADGVKKTYPLPYDAAFDDITKILEKNELLVFRASREKKYIVAMGFHQQVDTTRVGIFFKPAPDGATEITLSSLSPTALARAEKIIFEALDSETR